MKKIFTVLMIMGLIISITVSPAIARPPYSHHHSSHHGDWGAFGFGLLTGAVVTNLFYGPPHRRVVIRHAPAVVYYPDPVIIQEAPGVIEVPETPTGEVVVSVTLLNVRTGPGKNHPVTHQVWRGSKLVIQGSSPRWLYVKLPSGEYGWVMRKFTVRVQPPASG